MELRDIEIFVTLAEEMHFGRTAERLHVSPSRVSQAIKQQERRIGAALFERTSRVVRLTPLGQKLYDELEPAYRRINLAIDAAADNARGLTGTLRTGYSGAWCGDLLAQAADVFQRRFSDVTVTIGEFDFKHRFSQLRDRDVDLLLIEHPIDEPDIVTGPILFREPRALVVAADHPLAAHQRVCLEDLAGIPLVVITGQPEYFLDFHLPRSTPSGAVIPRGPAAGDWQSVLTFVAAGKAVCPASWRARHFHTRHDVVYIPFSGAPPVEYGPCWLKVAENAKIRTFTRLLVETAAATT